MSERVQLTHDDWYKMDHHDWMYIVNDYNDLVLECIALRSTITNLRYQVACSKSGHVWERADFNDPHSELICVNCELTKVVVE